jgi:hypothetical protein
MIGHAADSLGNGTGFPCHATEAGVKAVAPFRGDSGFAVLRREYDVEMEREVCRWHGGGFRCPCRGTGSFHTKIRWLSPPANFTCPYRGTPVLP